MATVKYSENACVISGLQGGTRDHKASETERAKVLAYDIMINAISALPVKHGKILDNQGYYFPTIARKAAYHGAFIKEFALDEYFQLVIVGSLDHQYPLEICLVYRELIVKYLYSFKSSSRAISNELLPKSNELTMLLANKLNSLDFAGIAWKIDQLNPNVSEFSKHFRYFKQECASIMESLGI
jgi:hypothetical protein